MTEPTRVLMTLTHAAEVMGRARGDLDGLKQAAEKAVEEIGAGTEDGPDDIMDIFFHTFSWHGEYNFILFPSEDKTCLIVDACEMEEGPEVQSGPMKGRRIVMPRPFSGDDDKNDTPEDDHE